MKYDVVTIGGLTRDIMFSTGKMQVLENRKKYGPKKLFAFEEGDKIVSDRPVLYAWGGGGANTAVSLARLNLKVAIVGSLGDDQAGKDIVKHLKIQGVETKYLKKIKDSLTGLSLVVTGRQKHEHVIFANRAANLQLKLEGRKLAFLKAGWYYLTSLSGPHWQGNLETLFKSVKGQVAWNPGGTQLKAGYQKLKKFLYQTDLLVLNRREAMELILSSGRKEASPRKMLKILSEFGPETVGITDGPKGAYLYAHGQHYFQKALPVKGVNTTGAGDAFGSSLVAGLIIFKDLKKALSLAMVRSNYVVRVAGAQEGLLTLAEAKKKMR